MEYPKHLFRHPGPYGSGGKSYAVAGAEDESQKLSLMERGWHESVEGALTATNLDHDGNGKAGGSVKHGGTDMAALRAEYTAIAGKRPFPGWDDATLRQKMATLREPK